MYSIGIDVGGTNLKAGLVDETGAILASARTPLEFTTPEAFAGTLAELSREVLSGHGPEEIGWVGIGIPGAVQDGTILFTANIPMRDVPLTDLFRKELDLPVYLANDADCAAAGEYFFGCGKGTKDFVIVTLGTGVGGGMILNGKLHTGNCCAGEIGHMVVEMGGAPCSCGRRGCLESYASATGLIRMAREALREEDHSLLAGTELSGRTIFEAADRGDALALSVTRRYVEYLSVGVTNLVNILQPEVIAVGGGVADAPEHLLLKPLQENVHTYCYGRHVGHYPRVLRATLKNNAGIVGAAMIGRLL